MDSFGGVFFHSTMKKFATYHQFYKVTSSNSRSNDKLVISPWYDRECSRQRKIYNRLRNKCNNSKSDSDKRDRDDAKKHMFNSVNLSQRHTITIRLIH